MYVPAHLKEDQLEKIKQFEEQKHTRVVALAEIDVEPAPLEPDELSELKDLEKAVGCCLLAVK